MDTFPFCAFLHILPTAEASPVKLSAVSGGEKCGNGCVCMEKEKLHCNDSFFWWFFSRYISDCSFFPHPTVIPAEASGSERSGRNLWQFVQVVPHLFLHVLPTPEVFSPEKLSGVSVHDSMISGQRSRQAELLFSISCSFHSLFHFFSCFSRCRATSRSSKTSKYKRECTWYFFVNPSTTLCLCWCNHCTRSCVQPT